jgi:hypothetical protein
MHTFVKNGHYFREHRNHDPKQAIGSIRAAAYNPDMHRGEVIVWGDKKKAEKEYEEAKSGKPLDFSMSAKVRGDICSICGQFSRRSKDYCVHAKKHMTQWMPKYSKFVYVDNVEPNFFDISSVENRADRIARHLEIMFAPGDMEKAAGVNDFLFSDMLAEREGILLPDSFQIGCFKPENQQWLIKLAATEAYVNAANNTPDEVAKDGKFEFLKQAACFAFDGQITDDQLAAMRRVEPSILFGYLVKQAAVLPFKLFFAYATNQSIKAASEDPVYQHAQDNVLPNVFRDLLTSPSDYETEIMFEPAGNAKLAACPISYGDETILNQLAHDNSISPSRVSSRVLNICAGSAVQPAAIKQASVTCDPAQTAKAKVVAKAYAFYKIAFCDAVTEINGQEIIDDAALLLLTSNHNI